MGNELFLYKTTTDSIWEKQSRFPIFHSDVETIERTKLLKPSKELQDLKQTIVNKEAEISSLKT